MSSALAQARAELAPRGVIRAAINLANAATVRQDDDGSLSGLCIDLARGLGCHLGLPVEFACFSSAGQIVTAEETGDVWDIAFLAIDPARAARLHFSPPYLTIEGGYCVPTGSSICEIAQVDQLGVRIVSATRAAYDFYLERTLQLARRYSFADPAAAFAAFDSGGYDAIAGLRPNLERQFFARNDIRILPGSFVSIRQAMAVPTERHAAAEMIDCFVNARP